MSQPPRFDHQVLATAWGERLPKALTRESRVRLLGEFADAVLTGREPSREALLFLAGAIRAYLAKGGSLERDYLRVGAKAGSHRTPAALWAAQQHETSSRGEPGSRRGR
jgi:hypothetical protein